MSFSAEWANVAFSELLEVFSGAKLPREYMPDIAGGGLLVARSDQHRHNERSCIRHGI